MYVTLHDEDATAAIVERIGGLGERWSATLPLVSAVVVTLLGAVIVLKALGAA